MCIRDRVKDVLRAAGLAAATITSTARTPADQARAMYQNLVGTGRGQGVANQRRLYASAGDKIIDVFEELQAAGKTPAEIQAGMRDRIMELGPGTVSRHLADPATLNVVDIAPSSLGDAAAVTAFEGAARALVGSRIARLLTPGDRDPAEHLEIKPVGGVPTATTPPPVTGPPPPAPTAKPPKPTTTTPTKAPPTTTPPTTATPPTTTPTTEPARVATDSFVKDVDRKTWELLPPKRRAYFEGIEWNDLDYPGAKYPVKDTSPENLDKWRAKPGYKVFNVQTKKGEKWYVRGTHQADAEALFLELSRVRPGGGERRVNQGPAAILTKAQYGIDPSGFDEYIQSQLRDPATGAPAVTGKALNQHAATAFVKMREAAAKDGVVLSIGNAFRERKAAEASAKKKDNAKAVASFSAHSLGLAMDLNLRVKGLMGADETTTRMTNTIKLMGAPAYKWMFQHGAEYGWFQYRAEPWHWEYNPSGFAASFWAEAPDLAPETKKKA